MPFTPAGELDHLAGLDIVEAVDAGDAVADGQHLADVGDVGFVAEVGDLRFRMAEISAARISILPSLPLHGGTEAVELGAEGRIDHARADLDDQAAEKRGIDLGVKARFLAQLGLERGLEFVDFGVVEGAGGGDFRFGLAARPGDQTLILLDDLGQHEEAALVRQQQHEFDGQRLGAHFFQHGLQGLGLILGAEHRGAHQAGEIGTGLHGPAQGGEIGADRIHRLLVLGQFKHGIGITPCQSAFRRFARHS